jgi:hypothetical protein
MDAEDVSLLQCAYTQNITLTASLVKQMAVAFSETIRPAALRHAILAYAALRLPQHFYGKFQFHKAKARHTLILKIQTPDLIEDADVFASQILAWIALCQDSREEALVHAHGCISMMETLRHSGRPGRSSDLLAVFSPLILDNMNIVIAVGRDVPTTTSTFAQRVPYYRELCRTGTPPEAWRSADLETIHGFVRGAVCVSIVTLKQIAIKERNGLSLDKRMSATKALTAYIQSKTEDRGFQSVFNALAEWSGEDTRKGCERAPEQQLFGYQLIGLQSLRLVLAIIEDSTILSGVCSPEVMLLADGIRSALRSTGPPIEALRYYRDAYYCHMSLSGMALTEDNEGNLYFDSRETDI